MSGLRRADVSTGVVDDYAGICIGLVDARHVRRLELPVPEYIGSCLMAPLIPVASAAFTTTR